MLSHDSDTQALFYEVIDALELQHVQLDISTNDVAVTNITIESLAGTVVAFIYSLANEQLFIKSAPVSLAMNASSDVMQLPLIASI